MTPKEFARELVWRARKKLDKSDSCIPPGHAPDVVVEKYQGWSFGLDVYEHADMKRYTRLPGDVVVSHYRLSAKLHPPGRSSTNADWGKLGAILAEITHATGYPTDAPPVEPVLPIEAIHPNSTIHWMWHHDGSPVDPRVVELTAAAVAVVQDKQIERARDQGLAVKSPVMEKIQRNAPCPCGSGKKYKKCHGAPN